jgi:hypothetical protein
MAIRDHEESMTEAEIIDATYWAGFWSRLEHWMFAGVVITLAVEFLALKFAEPHKEKLEDQRELKIAELIKDGQRLSKEAETARSSLARAEAEKAKANEGAAKANERAVELRKVALKAAMPRVLDSNIFKKALEGIPTASVEVLYDRSAWDGYNFAGQIWQAVKWSGWEALPKSGPVPLKEPPADSPLSQLPLDKAAGAWTFGGLTVVSREQSDMHNKNDPVTALSRALSTSTEDMVSGLESSNLVPAGTFRVIVGPRMIPAPPDTP